MPTRSGRPSPFTSASVGKYTKSLVAWTAPPKPPAPSPNRTLAPGAGSFVVSRDGEEVEAAVAVEVGRIGQAVRTAGDGVNDRREEAAAGVRQGDGNARRPDRHRHIRAVVAVEVAERGPSGHAGDDGFGGAEVRLPVVAAEYQVVPDDDGEILVAVAIDVHRGKRSLERERETGHQCQRAGPVVREQPEADRMHRRVAFAGRNHVGVRIPVEVRHDVHPGRRRRRESRRSEVRRRRRSGTRRFRRGWSRAWRRHRDDRRGSCRRGGPPPSARRIRHRASGR